MIGIQPIVIISRPVALDPYIFAAMTFFIVSFIFLPFMIMERKKLKAKNQSGLLTDDEIESLLHGWKKNKKFLIYLGIVFGFGRIFFFIGVQLAGAINSSLVQKVRIIFALLFGYLILQERFSKKQIFFSVLLFFGLFLAITNGSFLTITNVSDSVIIGVIVLLILGIIWTLAHTQTKPIIDKKEVTPISIVFIRSIIGAIILISTYFLFFPLENVNLFYEPVNLYYFLAIGLIQGLGLYSWYKAISYMEFSKATILVAPTPIITALFAYFILEEPFTIFHLIGTIIVIFSIIMIVREKQNDEKQYEIN